MGFLFNAESRSLLVEHEDFAKTLRAVKRLAKEAPGQFYDPAAVAGAGNLMEALGASLWEGELDAAGDLVSMRYLADKLPPDADTFDPFLAAIATGARHGRFRQTFDEGDPWFVEMRQRKLWRGWLGQLEQVGALPRARIGETVELRFAVETDAATRLELRSIACDLGRCPADDRLVTVAGPHGVLRRGETYAIRATIGPDAPHGPMALSFAEPSVTLSLFVDAPEKAPAKWRIASQWCSADAFLRTGDMRRALVAAQRFAARWMCAAGGEFLTAAVSADSIDAALAAAGVVMISSGRNVELGFPDELPGSEELFWNFLCAIAAEKTHTGRTEPAPFLRVHYEHAPDLEWCYELRRNAHREVRRRI
jgi:hypothetical protein